MLSLPEVVLVVVDGKLGYMVGNKVSRLVQIQDVMNYIDRSDLPNTRHTHPIHSVVVSDVRDVIIRDNVHTVEALCPLDTVVLHPASNVYVA